MVDLTNLKSALCEETAVNTVLSPSSQTRPTFYYHSEVRRSIIAVPNVSVLCVPG